VNAAITANRWSLLQRWGSDRRITSGSAWPNPLRAYQLSTARIPADLIVLLEKGPSRPRFQGNGGPGFDRPQIRAMYRVCDVSRSWCRLRVRKIVPVNRLRWSRRRRVHAGPGFDRLVRWHVSFSRSTLARTSVESLPRACFPTKSRKLAMGKLSRVSRPPYKVRMRLPVCTTPDVPIVETFCWAEFICLGFLSTVCMLVLERGPAHARSIASPPRA